MKKIILPLLLSLVMTVALILSAVTAFAETKDTSEEDYYLISAKDLETLREDIRKELLAEFQDELENANKAGYKEVTATRGQVVILAHDSELIYRGGGAVAITSSNSKNDGLTDISSEKEIFSGQKLDYCHIYVSKSQSVKAVLVTGEQASFTIRGNYEIG